MKKVISKRMLIVIIALEAGIIIRVLSCHMVVLPIHMTSDEAKVAILKLTADQLALLDQLCGSPNLQATSFSETMLVHLSKQLIELGLVEVHTQNDMTVLGIPLSTHVVPSSVRQIRDQVANEQLDRVLAHEPDPP